MSLGLSLAAIPAVSSAALPATLPATAQSQNMPSLAPMLEKVLPAVVNIHVSGTRVQSQQIPEELKFFLAQIYHSNNKACVHLKA